MAEYLLGAKIENSEIHVSSTGTLFGVSGRPMDGNALAELAKRGIDGSAHRARTIAASDIYACDLVICMEADHVREATLLAPDRRDRIYTLVELAALVAKIGVDDATPGMLHELRTPLAMSSNDMDVADPIGRSSTYFADCADMIEEYLSIATPDRLPL